MTARALNMLGLCARSGGLVSGEAAVEQAVKRGGAKLALVDAGASARSKKAMRDACAFAGAALFEAPAGAIGQAVGRAGRMAVAVTDARFAGRIAQLCVQAGFEAMCAQTGFQ